MGNDKIVTQSARDNKPEYLKILAVKKKAAEQYADALYRVGEYKASARVHSCSSVVKYAPDTGGRLHCVEVQFCKDRMCPICAWRKSREIYRDLCRALSAALTEGRQAIFLTLTVRNCTAGDLSQTVTDVFTAWNRLMSNKSIKSRITGGFRALELTYNAKSDTYHPHIHAVLVVEKAYFDGKYLSRDEWSAKWKKALRTDYVPQVWVEAIREKRKPTDHDAQAQEAESPEQTAPVKAVEAAAAEVAKYVSKPSDYLPAEGYAPDIADSDSRLVTIRAALRGRRLYAYVGGVKPPMAAEAVTDKAELLLDQIVTYRWKIGFGYKEV